MKNTILLAGFVAFGVFALFVGLSLRAGQTAAGESAAEARLVPALERINADRNAAEKSSKEAYHTKEAPPKIKIFQTSYKDGTQVTFNHARHVDTYNLKCIECHHVERCSKCHLQHESHTMEVAKGKQAFHENCIGCHSDSGGPEDCQGCHKQ